MYRTWTCLTEQHDWRLVILAAGICLVSSLATIELWWRTLSAQPNRQEAWLLVTGVAGGFGVWSTHFIAMLAYQARLPVTYDIVLTLTSLAMVILVFMASLRLATKRKTKLAVAISGAGLGLGVTMMHYMGIEAIGIPGRFEWSSDLILTSVLVGMTLGAIALSVAYRGRDRLHFFLAGTLLMLAVASHHFIAMGALTIVADPSVVPQDSDDFSGAQLGYAIGVTAFAVIAICITAAVVGQRARRGAHDTERRFRMLVESVQEYAIYMLDENGVVANWNAGAERLKQYTAEEIVGRHFSVFFTEEDRALGEPQRILSEAREKGRIEVQGWRQRRDGSCFLAKIVIQAMHDEEGRFIGWAKITRDVTERHQARERMEAANQQLQVANQQMEAVSQTLDRAINNMSQGLCMYSAEEKLLVVNSRYHEIMNVRSDAVRIGMSFLEVLTALADARRARGLPGEDTNELYTRLIGRIRTSSNVPVIRCLLTGQVLSTTHNTMLDGSWITTVEDITARRRSEEQIAHMAEHDSLTGLPNRTYLAAYLNDAIVKQHEDGVHLALLAIDLNRFKEINDQYGHGIGDTVLATLAARMQGLLKPGELFARVGGDEFIGVKRFRDRAEVQDLVKRIEESVFQPIQTDEADLPSSGSIGIALYPRDAGNVEQLMNNADLAMYRAKTQLGRRVCFYEANMDELARARRLLINDLWKALEREEFAVYYQVQKDMQTGQTTGYEALVRWNHPTRGFVSPVDFIPVAEECGAIMKLGEWVLRRACLDAAGWPEPWKVAVNLSAVQLASLDLVGLVEEILSEAKLPASRLELEITETSIISDKKRALRLLSQIKTLGVSIAIDDFGTGYASLDTLNSFPFDKIKIDRSFLIDAEHKKQSKAILCAILALGKSLGVPVLAEGIETEAQVDMLRLEGCDVGQGYLFGRPAPLSSVTNSVAAS